MGFNMFQHHHYLHKYLGGIQSKFLKQLLLCINNKYVSNRCFPNYLSYGDQPLLKKNRPGPYYWYQLLTHLQAANHLRRPLEPVLLNCS